MLPHPLLTELNQAPDLTNYSQSFIKAFVVDSDFDRHKGRSDQSNAHKKHNNTLP